MADQADSVDMDMLMRGYTAMGDQDWDTAAALHAEDIEWFDPPEVPDGGRFVGRAAVRASWENYREVLDEWAVEPLEVKLSGDKIFVHSRVTGVMRIGDMALEPDLFQVWTARDGKLIRQRAFLDRSRALEAAGLPAD